MFAQPFHPLFCSEEVSQGPEILQDDLVAPRWQRLLAQKATVASVATEQEEEVGVTVKEFSGQKVVWGPAHGVISTTDTQHRYGCLIHIPEGVVVVPVGIPTDGETLGVAEEGLLKLSKGAAPEQFAGVHGVLQGCGIPGSKKLNREGKKEGRIRKQIDKLADHRPDSGHRGFLWPDSVFKTSISLSSFKIRRFHIKCSYQAPRDK